MLNDKNSEISIIMISIIAATKKYLKDTSHKHNTIKMVIEKQLDCRIIHSHINYIESSCPSSTHEFNTIIWL